MKEKDFKERLLDLISDFEAETGLIVDSASYTFGFGQQEIKVFLFNRATGEKGDKLR